MLVDSAAQVAAVEPQKGMREELLKCGYNVYEDISEVSDSSFEIITLFHVLEHFTNPVKTLQEIAAKLEKGGKIIIEIPHANDFLLSWFDLESFKEFTFWSEHLILHTRQSLKVFLENSGFINISIKGIQRYPLANHLYWLSRGKPNGHNRWSHLSTEALDNAYADMLASLDCTDTLLAIAER